MRSKCLDFRKIVYLMSFIILFTLVYSSGTSIALGQKKPKTLKLDVDADDKQLCVIGSSNKSDGDQVQYQNNPKNKSQFCEYFDAYDAAKKAENVAGAKTARNEMIDLVRGQVDTYYKLRKDGRKTNIRWLQTLLDILEIGTATSITIMKGERAKTVVAAALNGLQGGRTAFNKNFEILQTQVLINKMNANRAEILTEIFKNRDLDIDDYSWYAAKNDLRRYLFAGTFNNALDTLVDETGADVIEAERELREVGEQKLTTSATLTDAKLAEDSAAIKKDLRKKLKGTDEEKADALKKIKAIVTALESDDAIQKLLESKDITSDSADGEKILNALRDIIIEQTREGRAGRDIIAKINRTFIEQNKEE